MVAIRARFDGIALILEQPVESPRDRTLIIHGEAETQPLPDESFLRPVLVPSDPDAARRLIHDPELLYAGSRPGVRKNPTRAWSDGKGYGDVRQPRSRQCSAKRATISSMRPWSGRLMLNGSLTARF